MNENKGEDDLPYKWASLQSREDFVNSLQHRVYTGALLGDIILMSVLLT